MEINIKKALELPGWMLEPELEFLAEQASKHYRIVEIGSFRGRSSRAMADNMPEGGRLVCVDTWEPEDPSLPLSRAYEEEFADPNFSLINDFGKNMEGLDNYVVLQMTSIKAAEWVQSWASPKFDMIFIDADHTYESVKQDIQAWYPLLKPGGLICGHDYDEQYWPGVVKAVRELFPEIQKATVNTIWSRIK